MNITLLLDNPQSWFYPHAKKIQDLLSQKGHTVGLIHTEKDMTTGDLAFFLSCEKIIKKPIRDLHTHNLVVHSSALPQGKGWSPLTWSILAGEQMIMNTLFEAVDAVDAGTIYAQNSMTFDGTELLPELHEKQGNSIVSLVLDFVDHYPTCIELGKEQTGQESFFARRGPEDSQLDIDKTLTQQMNLLRVVDNEKYPAFFWYKDKKYILKIYQANDC